jgi:PleD family two-component response regulator
VSFCSAFKRADEALYWVKRNGRDAVMAWEDLNPTAGQFDESG